MPTPQKNPQNTDLPPGGLRRTPNGSVVFVEATPTPSPTFTVYRDETAGPALPSGTTTAALSPGLPLVIDDTLEPMTPPGLPPPASQPPRRYPLGELDVNVVNGASAGARTTQALAGTIPTAELRDAQVSCSSFLCPSI